MKFRSAQKFLRKKFSTSTSTTDSTTDSTDSISIERRGSNDPLDTVNATDLNLVEVPAAVYDPSVSVVRLSRNRIEELPANMSLSLRVLSLSENLIQRLPDELFTLPLLELLDCRKNKISIISRNIGVCFSLKALYLSNNCLKRLPNTITNCVSLHTLLLKDNHMESLPQLSSLSCLEVLDLSHNKNLGAKVKRVKNLPSLRKLNCSHIGMILTPSSWAQFNNLHSICLSHNELFEFPFSLCYLPQLKNLDLDSNMTMIDIKNVLIAPGDRETPILPRLRTLRLSRCNLRYLPTWFSNLTSLKVLDISFNRLTEIPMCLTSMTALTTLNVECNNLRRIPCLFTNVRSLSVGRNEIETLPAEIGKLTDLRELDCHMNNLFKIHENIGLVCELKLLDLESNNLYDVGPLTQCAKLSKLNLSQNYIVNLPKDIDKWVNIRRLLINRNMLFDLPDSIIQCTTLEKLFLEGNPFDNIPRRIPKTAQYVFNYVKRRVEAAK